MSENDKLDLILFKLQDIQTHLQTIDKRLDGIEERLDRVEARLDRVEERLDRVEERLDRVEERVDRLEDTVNRNYAMTEEFYVSQKEANEEFRAEFRVIHGTLDMHARQIARNTALLKEYKIS